MIRPKNVILGTCNKNNNFLDYVVQQVVLTADILLQPFLEAFITLTSFPGEITFISFGMAFFSCEFQLTLQYVGEFSVPENGRLRSKIQPLYMTYTMIQRYKRPRKMPKKIFLD